jgi:SAM-dependent methyltransferase
VLVTDKLGGFPSDVPLRPVRIRRGLAHLSEETLLGPYASAAEFYDLLYGAAKDYRAEAELLASVIREEDPGARRILDVACGTGEHARHLAALGFAVDGVDIEPAFVELARAKCPEGTFRIADMTSLDLGETFDVVLCLFSAIGYVRTTDLLNQTVAHLARHLEPDGLLVVDPWLEPGQLTHGHVSILTGEAEDLVACRVSRTWIEGRVSTLQCQYLIGRPQGVEHLEEMHELGLFTQEEMERAFRGAGLTVRRVEKALRTRGMYVGRREGDRPS